MQRHLHGDLFGRLLLCCKCLSSAVGRCAAPSRPEAVSALSGSRRRDARPSCPIVARRRQPGDGIGRSGVTATRRAHEAAARCTTRPTATAGPVTTPASHHHRRSCHTPRPNTAGPVTTPASHRRRRSCHTPASHHHRPCHTSPDAAAGPAWSLAGQLQSLKHSDRVRNFFHKSKLTVLLLSWFCISNTLPLVVKANQILVIVNKLFY